jgi:hypothetical protein
MRLRNVLVLLFSLAFLGGPAAFAAPQSYVVSGTIPGLGSAHVVGFTVYGQADRAYAVGFEASLAGTKGVSFCGDLLHRIGLDQTYAASPIDVGGLAAGYGTAAKMAQRWSFDLGSLAPSLADAAAGAQLAIWETIYGNQFTLTSPLGAGTKAAYDTVLGTDYAGLGQGNTVFLDVSKGTTAKQDHFFTPNGPSTPEPGAALLYAAGLVIVAHALRRELA